MENYLAMVRSIVLSLPETEEQPHFDRIAFKISGKVIFATFHDRTQTVNLLLSPETQNMYCSFDEKNIYSVANKFGLKGWTTFAVKTVSPDLLTDALHQAYKLAMDKKPNNR